MALKRALGEGEKSHQMGTLLGLDGFLGLLGKKYCLDVGQHTALSDGDTTEEFVQLFVVADSQLQVARNDASLLVVAGSVASQLKDLGRQILENGGEIDGRASSHTLRVIALTEKSVNTTHGKR